MRVPLLAAGLSMVNSDGKRHAREYDMLKRKGITIGDVLGVLTIFCLAFGALWVVA